MDVSLSLCGNAVEIKSRPISATSRHETNNFLMTLEKRRLAMISRMKHTSRSEVRTANKSMNGEDALASIAPDDTPHILPVQVVFPVSGIRPRRQSGKSRNSERESKRKYKRGDSTSLYKDYSEIKDQSKSSNASETVNGVASACRLESSKIQGKEKAVKLKSRDKSLPDASSDVLSRGKSQLLGSVVRLKSSLLHESVVEGCESQASNMSRQTRDALQRTESIARRIGKNGPLKFPDFATQYKDTEIPKMKTTLHSRRRSVSEYDASTSDEVQSEIREQTWVLAASQAKTRLEKKRREETAVQKLIEQEMESMKKEKEAKEREKMLKEKRVERKRAEIYLMNHLLRGRFYQTFAEIQPVTG
jgi:hypothetical protein